MQRILVFGNAGSGKSTFAKKLAKILGCSVFHLDAELLDEKWQRISEEKEKDIITSIIQKPQRIIEGNYKHSFPLRVEACDTIIYLGLSKYKCLINVFIRFLKGKFSNGIREDIGVNKEREKFHLLFYKWIWNFDRQSKPFLFDICARYNKPIIQLSNYKEYNEFLTSHTP